MTSSIRRVFAGVLLTALVMTMLSCAGPKVKDDDIVATWGDTSMTVAQFKDWMFVRYRNDAQAAKQSYQDRLDVMDEYIIRDCKLLEGRRLGFDKREDIQKQFNDAMERKAVELLYNDKVRDRMFSQQMIRDWFEHDQDEVRCRHLLIEIPDSTGRDTLASWQKINDIYQKAKAGADFIKLVDQYSEDKTIEPKAHGDLGFFRWGKMVDEFEQAAWKLKAGEVSPPVRTRYGYHLIQVVERRPTNLEYRTSHILVKLNRKDSPAETTIAFERAKMILAEAKKSGADFAQVARNYSEDEKSWVSGDVGWVPRGTMPTEYWDKVFTMQVGQIEGPVRSYKGYHIIRLDEKRLAPRDLDDPEVRNDVLAALERMHRDAMKTVADKYMDSVKTSMGMEFDQATVAMILRKLGDKSAPTNMNLFSSLTPEEREMLVVHDKLGGIKVQELVDMYGDHRFPPQYRNEFGFVKDMVEPFLMPKYLTQFAKNEGYLNRPEVIADGKRTLDNAILPEVEKEMVYDKGTPTEDELRKYYNANIAKFTQAETRSGFEIMVDDKQLAGDLLGRIRKGEDIATLARRYTMRTKVKGYGGKLGPFTKDEYGAVSRKAFDMSVGELAGLIDIDRKSWSLFKLTEIQPGKVQDFEEVRKQAESEVRFQNQKGLKDAWLAELKRAYDYKVYEPVLRNVWPVAEPLPESLVAERKKWKDERYDAAKRKSAEDRIKLQLKPGSEQEFTTKEGKRVSVKIGEPRYVDKSGKEIDASKSKVKLTPEGRFETKEGKPVGATQPVIKLKPKSAPGQPTPPPPSTK